MPKRKKNDYSTYRCYCKGYVVDIKAKDMSEAQKKSRTQSFIPVEERHCKCEKLKW
jgi:hypothetical protein